MLLSATFAYGYISMLMIRREYAAPRVVDGYIAAYARYVTILMLLLVYAAIAAKRRAISPRYYAVFSHARLPAMRVMLR